MNPPSYTLAMETDYHSQIAYRQQVEPVEPINIHYNLSNLYTNLRSKKDYYNNLLYVNSFKDIPSSDKELIKMYGKYLGVNLRKYPYLLKYVLSSIIEPLPSNWEECVDYEGNIYYLNKTLSETKWRHPCEDHYKTTIKNKIKETKCW